MPIYAYKCSICGLAKDVLQKIADAPLTDCPACGAASFSKQITAAGFQLKGSGWYATDFRNGSGKPADKPADKTEDKPADPKTDSAGTAAAPAAAPATATAAAPACGSGGCAACT